MEAMEEKDLHIGKTYRSVKFDIPVRLTAEDIWELVERAEGASISHYIEEMFQPILLTEEWLLRFGFKKETEEMEGGQFYIYKGRLVVKRAEDFYGYESSIKIMHVHQLQNLYFALTGEELTIQTK